MATLAGGAAANAGDTVSDRAPSAPEGPASLGLRRGRAHDVRVTAASAQLSRPVADHPVNGDEDRYPTRFASYSKGLPHDELGHVDPAAYAALLRAVESGDPAAFDRIPRGSPALAARLKNPQAGLAFVLQGADPEQLTMRPAPAFASDEAAGEMVELYWMALARDVPFAEYTSSALVAEAADDLSGMSDFRGPKFDGEVTGATLFRADVPGALVGPFVSQFLWLDAPFGAERVDRRIRTTVAGRDYLTSYGEWLATQNGDALGPAVYDDTRRYIRNGRDLAEWVHRDVLFQLAFDAFLNLVAMGAPLDAGNPYSDAVVDDGEIVARIARNQCGFGTFGEPYIASLLGTVAKLAVIGVWHQKWFVHRRLRPEEYAGRVHNHLQGTAAYPVPEELLRSAVLERLVERHGTHLLPQAYPEGCPIHPAYGAGHATVAGATITILKALFDESFVIQNPVETNLVGTGIFPYEGAELTVGGELNKLASNIATGRNMAGIHWRTDLSESLKLGEEIALRLLEDERRCFNEDFDGFTLTSFDGAPVTV